MTYPTNSSVTDLNSASAEASRAKTTSLFLGILGLFTLGIVLGPIAVHQANKAERLGERATAGRVLGYICIVLSIVQIVFFALRFIG